MTYFPLPGTAVLFYLNLVFDSMLIEQQSRMEVKLCMQG